MQNLKALLDAGKITQAEYDAVIGEMPANPAAWDALTANHDATVAALTAERDAAIAREAAKDKIIMSFSTRGNPNAAPDADPISETVAYINKKRGIKTNGN